jgi:hypothetical protein
VRPNGAALRRCCSGGTLGVFPPRRLVNPGSRVVWLETSCRSSHGRTWSSAVAVVIVIASQAGMIAAETPGGRARRSESQRHRHDATDSAIPTC